jgi:hypothetical protein
MYHCTWPTGLPEVTEGGSLGWGARMPNRKLHNVRSNGAFWPEVTLWNITRSDRRSRDPEGGSLGWGARMRNRKLRNIRLIGPFHRKCPLRCSLGRPRPVSSMATGTSPFTGYLPLSRHFISAFNNGFQLRYFRICCVVLQVVYHVRVAFLLYFQRSWRFLIPSSNFRTYSTS